MKRIFLFALLSILCIGLSACGQGKGNEKNHRLSIVSTIYPSYDFAKEVVKEQAEVSMLLPPASESHSFEPTPKDIIKMQNADVFIYVGGESDEWVSDILESMDTTKMQIIKMIDCVETKEEVVVSGMQEEGEEEEPELDEHVWTSPKNAKVITKKIYEVISSLDGTNAPIYKKNTEQYLEKLDALDSKFQEVIQKAKRKTIIVADRFPFRYFADAYGLKYFAAFPGCATETEASAKTIKFLIDKVKDEKIPVVFHIELSNSKIADSIAEQTDAKVIELNAVHNVSKSNFKNGIGYYDLMLKNVKALKEALQ